MARVKTSKKHEGLKHKDVAPKPSKRSKDTALDQLEEDGDAELLKGSKGEGELTTGDQAVDAVLTSDVSQFLSGLQLGKDPEPKRKEKVDPPSPKKTFNKESKRKDEKKPAEKSEKKKDKPKPKAKEDAPSAPSAPAISAPSLPPNNSKLVFPPGPQWYSLVAPLTPPKSPLPTPSASQLSSLSERAANLLQKDAEQYQASAASTGHSASDSHFLNTILSQGTLSDRLSALTLLVQASPIHNTKSLESLRTMAERGRGKGGRDEGLKAMRCVVDWWIGGGAPGRKLKYFRDQTFLLHPEVTDQHLIMWYFEDWLKKYFFHILQTLETYSLDTLPYVRTQSLAFIFTLLRDKPEQEQNLLRLLVNKLGDTEKSVCSRASYHLLQVLQAHPAMKNVIVREIRSLIFRPAASTSAQAQQSEEKQKFNTHVRFTDDEPKKSKDKGKGKDKATKTPTMERWNTHAWYYSAVTLNQVVLTPSDHDRDVARLLIEAYFEMFREVLGTQGDGNDLDDAMSIVEDVPSKDGKDGKKKSKGKAKEVRGAAGFAEVEDSNSRLISAILTGVNRALPFAKVDVGSGNEMFKKHIDTLFLITHTSTFNISLQALMLILQVITTLSSAPSSSKTGETSYGATLMDRFYRTLYASLIDQRLAKSNKQAMYLNLLFKSLKADHNLDRVKAFVRRFVQVLVSGVGGAGGTEFVSGGLYLLGELFSTVSGLRDILTSSNKGVKNADGEEYDPRKRDPQYAHAATSPLYELLPLLYHYHPAISLHARQLLTGVPITASADLSLNTLSHFLDKFVYKNPKKPQTKGASAMQPSASSLDGTNVKLVRGEAMAGRNAPLNGEAWWKKRVEDVPADEIFFYKYFTRKHELEKEREKKASKRKGKDEDEDLEDDGDEDEEGGEENEDEEDSDKEEAEIWKVMKATMPTELQGDDLMDDSDEMPSDLDEDEEDEDEAELGDDEDEDEKDEDEDEERDDDDALSLAEDSDAEDLLSLDADVPEGLVEYDGSDVGSEDEAPQEEEWGGIDGGKKRKRGDDDSKSKKKKLRSLPTFASYEDYAKLIEDEPEDNI
ncbi:hypothetical protein QCA50_008844 [Cerrena zonata]|uniref:CCAAT-binding factor domain-containing protein n=1 Tax=Cerrena zonata TaxID=2478898 RepID=A0AAW0G2A3_9APHY